MFNELVLSSSFGQLKEFIINDISLFNLALTYTLIYVVYKAVGRYVYFKPEEHASKINRTFLFISIYIVTIHFMSTYVLWSIMIPDQYMWLYTLSTLVLATAFLSIIFRKVLRNKKIGRTRDWVHTYLPIQNDSYKSATSRSEESGNYSTSWNEETISFTDSNLHSDMMLNFVALTIFIVTNVSWIMNIKDLQYVIFTTVCTFSVSIIFIDQGIFKWMYFLRMKFSK